MKAKAQKRFRLLVSLADAARDERRFDTAAALYAEALRLAPDNAAIHVQCGHMFKEAGRLDEAEPHYGEALRLAPNDADLALQLGHFYKLTQRWSAAQASYRRALDLLPGWSVAAAELEALDPILDGAPAVLAADSTGLAVSFSGRPEGYGGRNPGELDGLVPELAPRRHEDLLKSYHKGVGLRRYGHRETTFWGNRNVLRGLESIRGVCIASKPVVEVQIWLDGVRIFRGPMRGGYALPLEAEPNSARKYVFNHWLDFSPFVRGLHLLEIRCIDIDNGMLKAQEEVVVADPVPESDDPDSSFLIEFDPADPRSIEAQVRTRPSMVRQAKRTLFPNGVRTVLVTRTDQLGDMVASIPAMLRLRELLPDAKIVGLFNYANGELARTLGILDDVIVIDFGDDPVERRRLMTLDAQEALRDRLAPYRFDIAIDLAQAKVSRDLLRLAGAKFTYGTGGEDWPWLSADFTFHTRDIWTRHDFTPHSTKVLALVEALSTLLKTSAPILRRSDISRNTIADYGLAPDERFAVLHTGARIGFSRWPYYGELARRLLDRTDLKLVIITEDPDFRATMPEDVLADPRVIFLDRRLPFDHFDAFLSFATVMVGNDSGPKHLASLRGTNVVTIFSARINWQEWGQENVGVIVSRKMPCAGCALLHDAEECGRDFICVTDIKVDEIFEAMMTYVVPPIEGRP